MQRQLFLDTRTEQKGCQRVSVEVYHQIFLLFMCMCRGEQHPDLLQPQLVSGTTKGWKTQDVAWKAAVYSANASQGLTQTLSFVEGLDCFFSLCSNIQTGVNQNDLPRCADPTKLVRVV